MPFQKGNKFGAKYGFKKGHPGYCKPQKGIRYNTGKTHFKKGHKAPKTAFQKGMIPWNKGKRHIAVLGEKNPAWKGGVTKQKGYNSFRTGLRRKRKFVNGGFHTLSDWEILKAQYNWTCPACKRHEPDIKLTEDHIIPISKGGSDNIENIQPLCRRCNCSKRIRVIKYEQ